MGPSAEYGVVRAPAKAVLIAIAAPALVPQRRFPLTGWLQGPTKRRHTNAVPEIC